MEGGAASEERCALLGELVQVLEMVRQLDAHMAGRQQLGGSAVPGGEEERCRALVATMRAAVDRSMHIATRSCCGGPQQLLPAFVAQPESPPSGGDGGSPRSAGSTDQAGDSSRGRATGQCKKRKTLPKWKTQVRVRAVQDVTPLDDGLSWRKYGQKDILGAKYPRAYFRCTHRHTQGCQASKQVQRTDGDPLLFDVVYNGTHVCAQQAQAAGHYPSSQQTSTANSPPQPPSFQLASNANDSGGCTTLVPTAAAAQVGSSNGDYTVGGGVAAGVRDVPEVEFASTTNSPMGDMVDFVFPLDDVAAADFFENTINYDDF